MHSAILIHGLATTELHSQMNRNNILGDNSQIILRNPWKNTISKSDRTMILSYGCLADSIFMFTLN